MRVAMVAQWLRAASGDPVGQAGRLALRGGHQRPADRLGAAAVPARNEAACGPSPCWRCAEMLVPAWAERAGAGAGNAVAPRPHQRALR